ncbi:MULTISPECIES: carbohydrate ABC transporter permease [unclassified Devosia]|jgi:multiple sugar transport system permease protein|uniref:carbohydrate ABC transporter permease n=1 Tax=unclassified Devosia TaxID=196773 RepID=UPI00086B7EA3|nr:MULTISPECIES: carbohydrate ABC transporter permease [unclassified Devosia]MBN9360919.1 carbohydrate ABC transporter permease [Devosia sp.]ODS88109.1 MAG: ABC transporter permease [Devosia sp. SCN 66-27]OJX22862.1 MAG: ABC transporter permease [Devosia sp. 66-14]
MTTKARSPRLRARTALALDILNHGALILVALLFLFPFFWMVSNAVRSNAEVLAIPVRILPNEFQWDNFTKAWSQLPFGRFFLNSMIVAGSVTVITVVVSCLAGYAFARLKFPGRDTLLLGYVGTLMVPSIMLIIPLFLIVNGLGMVNTFQGVILPVAFGTFGAFLLRQFFLSIPNSLEEAALIDGASRLRILISIIVPLSMPAIGLLSLFTFIAQWNNFLWPLIVMTGQENATLPVGLTHFQTQQGTQWNYIMAGAALSMLPGIVLAILLQKLIYNSIALNAGMGGR